MMYKYSRGTRYGHVPDVIDTNDTQLRVFRRRLTRCEVLQDIIFIDSRVPDAGKQRQMEAANWHEPSTKSFLKKEIIHDFFGDI